MIQELIYNYFIIKNNKTRVISDVEGSEINDINENIMDDNNDYMVFRENDEYDIKESLKKKKNNNSKI